VSGRCVYRISRSRVIASCISVSRLLSRDQNFPDLWMRTSTLCGGDGTLGVVGVCAAKDIGDGVMLVTNDSARSCTSTPKKRESLVARIRRCRKASASSDADGRAGAWSMTGAPNWNVTSWKGGGVEGVRLCACSVAGTGDEGSDEIEVMEMEENERCFPAREVWTESRSVDEIESRVATESRLVRSTTVEI
jgi:hypothetical protein